jgi:hypothetical protein
MPAQRGLSEAQSAFLDDAIQALAGLPAYGAPFFLELVDFEQRQASGPDDHSQSRQGAGVSRLRAFTGRRVPAILCRAAA